MPIIEKDIEYLRRVTSKSFRLRSIIALSAAIVFFIIFGILNLYLSNKFAAMEGYSLPQIIKEWQKGISTEEHYSGILLMSIQRFQMGITEIIFSVIGIFLLAVNQKRFNRNLRILRFIEEK